MNLIRNFPFFFALVLIVMTSSAFADGTNTVVVSTNTVVAAPAPVADLFRLEFTKEGQTIEIPYTIGSTNIARPGKNGNLDIYPTKTLKPARPTTREEAAAEVARLTTEVAAHTQNVTQALLNFNGKVKALARDANNNYDWTRISKADLNDLGAITIKDDHLPLSQQAGEALLKQIKANRRKHFEDLAKGDDSHLAANQLKLAQMTAVLNKIDADAKAKLAAAQTPNLTNAVALLSTNPPVLLPTVSSNMAPALGLTNSAATVTAVIKTNPPAAPMVLEFDPTEFTHSSVTNSASTK